MKKTGLFGIIGVVLSIFLVSHLHAQRTYYDYLGVSPTATDQEIRTAFRRKALEFHPDKHPSDEKDIWEEEFKRLGQVYEVLSDLNKRSAYDQAIRVGAQERRKPATRPQKKTYYTMLGIPQEATDSEINMRILEILESPEVDMRLVGRAQDILADPKRRLLYDQQLRKGIAHRQAEAMVLRATSRNYYNDLGLHQDASIEEIKRAADLMRKLPQFQDKKLLIDRAEAMLTDPQRGPLYNAYLKDGNTHAEAETSVLRASTRNLYNVFGVYEDASNEAIKRAADSMIESGEYADKISGIRQIEAILTDFETGPLYKEYLGRSTHSEAMMQVEKVIARRAEEKRKLAEEEERRRIAEEEVKRRAAEAETFEKKAKRRGVRWPTVPWTRATVPSAEAAPMAPRVTPEPSRPGVPTRPVPPAPVAPPPVYQRRR